MISSLSPKIIINKADKLPILTICLLWLPGQDLNLGPSD